MGNFLLDLLTEKIYLSKGPNKLDPLHLIGRSKSSFLNDLIETIEEKAEMG